MSRPAVEGEVDRVDPESPQANAVVEAATTCFDRWGVERTRMGDIARAAGVSRPTLYRYFPTKEALIVEVMVRHIRIQNERLRARVPLDGPARDVLNRALLLLIRDSRPEDLPGSLLRTESVDRLAQRTAESPEIFAAMSEFWHDKLSYAEQRGELRAGTDLQEAVRWLTFVVFVCLALPEAVPSQEHLDRYLDRFVVEALVDPPLGRPDV
jgi:AcrR family transcriptional regulator